VNRLLLHADDFGFNEAVTRGIIEGFTCGLLTSTSLLTNAPAAKRAIVEWSRLEQLRATGNMASAASRSRLYDPVAPFDLGVHLNLTQGRPLTAGRYPDDLLDAEGRFLAPGKLFWKLLSIGWRRRAALADELSAQIEWLLDHGVRATHLNGHQYVEMMPVVADVVPILAQRYQITTIRAACEPGHLGSSLRPGMRLANGALSLIKHRFAVRFRDRLDQAGIRHSDAYFGTSHAAQIDLRLMRRFVRLARSFRLSEIAFHPGQELRSDERTASCDGWHDPLTAARTAELRLLCSSELADLLVQARLGLARYQTPRFSRSEAA
jgi:chitin disaccharide deacetylase